MEFTKDIYFDNSLKAGNEAKITYSGSLFQNGSNNVNIVYGFGEAWNNTTTKPMEKAENGFVANVRMRDFDTFNFCFSNENNIWDNNNSFNYISPILPNVQEDTENNFNTESSDELAETNFNTKSTDEITETNNVQAIDNSSSEVENINSNYNEVKNGTNYSQSIDDIIEDILGNTTIQNIANEKDNNSVDKILESITKETLPEIEELFTDLFCDSVKQDENNNSTIQEASIEPELNEELKEFGKDIEANKFDIAEQAEILQPQNNPDTIATEDNTNLSKLFDELFEPYNTSENIVNENNVNANELFETADSFNSYENIENSSEQVESNTRKKISLVKPEVANSTTAQNIQENLQKTETAKLNTAAFNLDGLVSELLEPVITSETYADKIDETSLFDDLKAHEDENQENSLTVIDSNKFTISPRKLGYFYKVGKRIRLAFLKLAKIPKDLIKQLGF